MLPLRMPEMYDHPTDPELKEAIRRLRSWLVLMAIAGLVGLGWCGLAIAGAPDFAIYAAGGLSGEMFVGLTRWLPLI